MPSYQEALQALKARPRTWLVTGAAGFIGSHLVQTLLEAGQEVTGIDNFSVGCPANLRDIQACVPAPAWARFRFIEGDIRDLRSCREACRGAWAVLQQAALGSVSRSIEDPLATHQSNVDGFLNVLLAARDEGIQRFVFASSSSVYGDHPALPKVEANTGTPLSPYAVTKAMDEQYARVFRQIYGFPAIGLRYFNVFGPRQMPGGPYAAVIPRWIQALMQGGVCEIHGDGLTSRDYTYVADVVQANLLAATAEDAALGQIFNVSFGARTTLTELYAMIQDRLQDAFPEVRGRAARHLPFRAGDVAHSQADTTKARTLLGYDPAYPVARGMAETVPWFLQHAGWR